MVFIEWVWMMDGPQHHNVNNPSLGFGGTDKKCLQQKWYRYGNVLQLTYT